MTADVQGQPWSCWFFLFWKQSISPCVHYSSGKQLKGYLLCQFSHKSLLRHKKVTQGYGKKNVAISEAGLVFCQTQIEDCCSCGYWPPTSVLDQSNGLLQWLNIQCVIGSSSRSVTVGKWGRSERDFGLFYCLLLDLGCCTVQDHRSATHSFKNCSLL